MNTMNKRSRPLYWQVAEDIVSQVEGGYWKPGDRLPSERALCERYGVSQITVRRALRELAHAGQVYSHHGLGWFVSVPQGAASRWVTLVAAGLDPFLADLLPTISAALAEHGVGLRLALGAAGADVSGAEAGAGGDLDGAALGGSAALVLVAGGPEGAWRERSVPLARRAEVPALLLLRDVADLGLPAAILDEGACMGQLTQHVLSLGHRRVAYLGIDPSHFEGQQRYWGFATALWGSGLELPLDWVFTEQDVAGATAERFRQAFESAYRPTAMVCASDLLAAAALRRLEYLGLRCPDDVAVVGLGDREFAPLLSPPLTSFRFDLERLGQVAAAMLLDLIAQRAVTSTRVAGELVVRQSCGAGPARAF